MHNVKFVRIASLIMCIVLLMPMLFACSDPNDGNETDSRSDSEQNNVSESESEIPKLGPQGEPLYDVPEYEVEYIEGDSQLRYYKIKATISSLTEYTFLTRVPAKDRDALYSDMERQAQTINNLALANTDVNWYIYLATELADTEMSYDIFPMESTNELFNDFLDKLDPSIASGYVKLNSIQDKIDKFYLTDHHWNEYGYLEAYYDLVGMLQKKYPDIVLNEPTEHLFFEGVEWYGSYANNVNDRSQKDTFGIFNFALPDMDFTIENGVSYSAKKSRAEQIALYQAGNYNKRDTYGHYIYFYRIAKKITNPANNNGRNLLIIGDSYSPPLMETLAQYFDNTYVRYLDSNRNLRDIDYLDYVNENNITDVVVIQMSSRLVLGIYDDDINGLNLKK